MKEKYVHSTREAGKAFVRAGIEGEVVMLNLLKYREQADYSESPELAPESAISGAEAYRQYMKFTSPLIEKAGASVIYAGKPFAPLIGPADEDWDLMLLVKHKSVNAFVAFANNPEYLKTAGHRTAALDDSRLIPIVPNK
ncbi:MAG: DUF1330 domain-containing protein [Bacteroidota bacterium]